MSAVIEQTTKSLHLTRTGRALHLGITSDVGGIEITFNLAEARVLLDALEREIEAAMKPRSPIIDDMARVLLDALEREIEAAMAPRSPIINDDEPKEKT